MARLDPAIRHAITPPEFGENMLHREHLVDRLHGAIPNKLVAISAPAGYGKSKLLANFVSTTDLPICWVGLTDADGDVMRLASVLLASLERRFRRLQNNLDLRAHQSEPPKSVAAAFISLIEDNIPESFAIVFDDIHLVHHSKSALEFLDALIVDLPEQVTVIASGREVIEVSLARLMAEGQLVGLGSQDLAFRFEEVVSLISSLDGDSNLTDDEVSTIYEKTRGWPAGIVLANQSSSVSSLLGEVPEAAIYEYLGSVVLNRQPEHFRRFMLQASVLPVMSPPILDQVLSRSDSGDLLRRLHAKGLFITATSESEATYEFHPMFRNLLRSTLEASNPDRLVELQETAAEYLTQVSPETAVALYRDSGNYVGAAKIIEAVSQRYYSEGRFATLLDWLEWFEEPAQYVPVLAYYCGRILALRGKGQDAYELLLDVTKSQKAESSITLKALISCGMIALRVGWNDSAKDIVKNVEGQLGSSVSADTRAMAYRLQARFFMSIENRPEKAVLLLDDAVSELRNLEDHYELVNCLHEKARILGLAGKIMLARQAVNEALDLSKAHGSSLSLARALNNLAQLNYLSGDYEEALNNYQEAARLASRASSSIVEAWITLGQADVFCDLGLTRQAADLYGRLLEMAISIENRHLTRLGCLRTSVLHRRGGSYRTARDWIRRAQGVDTELRDHSLQVQEAALAVKVDPDGTLEKLRVLQTMTEQMEPDDRVMVHFLKGLVSFYGDDQNAASRIADCLDVASLTGGEQYLAAELRGRPEIRDWIDVSFRDHPVYSTVRSRIQLMETVARHYKGEREPTEGHSELRLMALAGGGIEWNGETVQGLKPQARELLFYLVDSGSAERDRLAEEFWSDFPPGRQAANLHMAVYSLRRKLGKNLILLDGSVYRVNPDFDLSYDVLEFERTADVALRLPPGDPRKLFALGESVRSYRGPFLPEYFSDWTEQRRRLLEQKYLDVVTEYADEAIRREQPDKAVAELRDALVADPLRDDLNGLYMEALGMMRRRSELVAHYERYSSLLDQEMGLEPSAEIQDLYAKFTGVSQ